MEKEYLRKIFYSFLKGKEYTGKSVVVQNLSIIDEITENKNKNNEDRFNTIASRISLDLLDIQKLKKDNKLNKNDKEIKTTNEFKNKVFKYLAKKTVFENKNNNITVQLNFVIPDNIWNKNYNLNTKIGINEKIKFNRMDYK